MSVPEWALFIMWIATSACYFAQVWITSQYRQMARDLFRQCYGYDMGASPHPRPEGQEGR